MCFMLVGGQPGFTGWTGFAGQIGFTGRRGWSFCSIITRTIVIIVTVLFIRLVMCLQLTNYWCFFSHAFSSYTP